MVYIRDMIDIGIQKYSTQTKGDSMENKTDSKKFLTIRQMCLTGLMTAIICVLAPVSLNIPISPVPISLGTLAIYFVLMVLGLKLGVLSVILYILLGLAGLPVFTGFTSGPGKLFGPTGGYIIGYIFLALISGLFAERRQSGLFSRILGIILGTAVMYLLGTFWLAYQTSCTLAQAFLQAVIPFLPGDMVKLILAASLGTQLRKRLQKAGLIQAAGNSSAR